MFKIEQTPSRHGCRLLSRFTVQNSDGVIAAGFGRSSIRQRTAVRFIRGVAVRCSPGTVRHLLVERFVDSSPLTEIVRAPWPFRWSSASSHQGTRGTPRSTGNLTRESNDDLQAMCFGQSALVQRRNCRPFPRAQRAGQTHCMGISKACRLFSMWLCGIHRSRTRIARSCARYSCGECSGFVE